MRPLCCELGQRLWIPVGYVNGYTCCKYLSSEYGAMSKICRTIVGTSRSRCVSSILVPVKVSENGYEYEVSMSKTKKTVEVDESIEAVEETEEVVETADDQPEAYPDVIEIVQEQETLLMPLIDDPDSLDAHLPTESAKDIKKRKRKKIILWSLIPLTIALIVSTWFLINEFMNNAMTEMEPTIVEVIKSDFNKTISETGALRPINSTLVAAPVSGTIEELYVAEGDRVEAGASLFLIGNAELDESVHAAQDARNTAAATAATARNSASTAQSQLENARVQVANLRVVYDVETDPKKIQALYDEIVSLDSRIVDLTDGATQAWAAVKTADAAVATADRALARATEERDSRLVIAPTSGVIVALNVNRGSVVSAGVSGVTGEGSAEVGESGATQSTVLEIADMSAMMIRAAISENDIASVEEGQNVRIALEALPDVELSGKVTRIAPQSKTQPSQMSMHEDSGSVAYNVDVRIDDLDPRLRIGMTGEVIIEVIALTDVIVIPIEALIYEGADTYVIVRIDLESSERRKVKTSESSEFEVVVTEGLEVGEMIWLPIKDTFSEPRGTTEPVIVYG